MSSKKLDYILKQLPKTKKAIDALTKQLLSSETEEKLKPRLEADRNAHLNNLSLYEGYLASKNLTL